MKRLSQYKSCQNKVLLCLFFFCFFLQKIDAQGTCGSFTTNAFFSYSQTNSSSYNQLGITVQGNTGLQGATHSWTISGPNNFKYSSSLASFSVSVPSIGTYNISYSISFKGQAQSTSCSLYVTGVAYPNIGILPNAPIARNLDTKLPVGTIKGTNSVSLTGGANYSIPISIPSGTKGVEPSINLDYNSQGGNGLMGMGWNFGAISSISAINANYYNSTEPAPISKVELYALNGNTLVREGNSNVFYTQSESFAKVTMISVPNSDPYFEVETKDGLKMTYGQLLESRIISKNRNGALVWYLNKTEDQYGNYVLYKYEKILNNNVILKEILYTGNEKAGITPYNSIVFDYLYRPDANAIYMDGIEIGSNLVLSSILIRAEGQQYRKYEFTYTNDKINTFLREVKVADGDNKQLNATLFQYGALPKEFENSTVNLSQTATTLNTAVSGDFNGDGKSDILLADYTVKNKNQLNPQKYYSSFRNVK
jgi:Salmonella virulence plasmid 65kDa B protein